MTALRIVRWVGIGLVWLIVLGLTAWATAALYIDLPVRDAGLPAAVVYVAAIAAALVLVPGRRGKAMACVVGFIGVLAWWLTLAPSNDRAWQPDVAQTPWADIAGNKVTIHNVRNVDYRAEFDYTPRWETRGYDLDDIRGVDLFITFWGSPWIAHPIVSFQFGDHDHIAISVETRKEVGEEYSTIRGFFRQYELVYIISDERDLIRLRTNYRTGEEVYLYRTTVRPETARTIFLSYLESANELHKKPAFYNAVTSNCTTNIRIHTKAVAGSAAAPWDWRLLLNGKGDEFAYEHGSLAGNLPFEALKQQAHINDAARAADNSDQFSDLIRVGRAGFANTGSE
jgi:hypothetical protein